MAEKRRQFTREFKLEAVRLVSENGRKVSEVARQLGIRASMLLVLGAQVVKRGLRARVDRKSRRDKSYFRIGWDYIAQCLRLGHPLPPLRLNPYVEKLIGG